MTHEERVAVAIVTLRLWGVHPTWIAYWKANRGPNHLTHIVGVHEEAYGDEAGQTVDSHFKQPCTYIPKPMP
jgi:hypothetical protein